MRRRLLASGVDPTCTVPAFLNLVMRKVGWGNKHVVRGVSHEQQPTKPKKVQGKKKVSLPTHKTPAGSGCQVSHLSATWIQSEHLSVGQRGTDEGD